MALNTAKETLKIWCDVEGCLSIQDSSWRIAPPFRPGPGRHVLATASKKLSNGLFFAITILNGHHGSQTAALKPPKVTDFFRRLTWISRERIRNTGAWLGLFTPRNRSEGRPNHFTLRHFKRNLVVSLNCDSRLHHPLAAFAIESTGIRNGRLVVLKGNRWQTIVEDLCNIRLHLGILVAKGYIWYLAASASGGPLAAPPKWQILDAIPCKLNCSVRGFIDQIVLGEVGFHVSSRVDNAIFDSISLPHCLSLSDGVGKKRRFIQLPAYATPEDQSFLPFQTVVLSDPFLGGRSPLDSAANGDLKWRRVIGKGRIERTGNKSVRVVANPQKPNPGRTAYATNWMFGPGADVCVTIKPPGEYFGDGVLGRGGVLLMQDPDNYIAISSWYDDLQDGASISTFWRINAAEDIYRAVWTNIGNRIRRGIPFQLRARFDGSLLIVWLDDEPVLERSIRDVRPDINSLNIHDVGLLANWEWGDDMGTVFRNFEVSCVDQGRGRN